MIKYTYTILSLIMPVLLAADRKTITGIAKSSKDDIMSFFNLIGALAFVCGICFFIAAMLKFKQFKDNPQQTTIGTPIMLLVIAVLLTFMPNLKTVSGETLFGSSPESSQLKFKTLPT
ncbi:type IV secretion protein IcmD [Gammaproteobacteria bacterium]|nr:type IV secretion protein IcmD [Gammaproteobacteria bacterium]